MELYIHIASWWKLNTDSTKSVTVRRFFSICHVCRSELSVLIIQLKTSSTSLLIQPPRCKRQSQPRVNYLYLHLRWFNALIFRMGFVYVDGSQCADACKDFYECMHMTVYTHSCRSARMSWNVRAPCVFLRRLFILTLFVYTIPLQHFYLIFINGDCALD